MRAQQEPAQEEQLIANVQQILYGVLRSGKHSAPGAAELRALAEALKDLKISLLVCTDHFNHVKSLHEGEDQLCDPKKLHVIIWRRV